MQCSIVHLVFCIFHSGLAWDQARKKQFWGAEGCSILSGTISKNFFLLFYLIFEIQGGSRFLTFFLRFLLLGSFLTYKRLIYICIMLTNTKNLVKFLFNFIKRPNILLQFFNFFSHKK